MNKGRYRAARAAIKQQTTATTTKHQQQNNYNKTITTNKNNNNKTRYSTKTTFVKNCAALYILEEVMSQLRIKSGRSGR